MSLFSAIKKAWSSTVERVWSLVEGNDGTSPVLVVQTPDMNTWLVIRDYGYRQQGLEVGTGAFISFQSTDAAGEWGDDVLLNGGLISREPGNEQGDLDLMVIVNGHVGGFAITGDMRKFGGPDAGFIPLVDRQMNLGFAGQRLKTLWAQELGIETVGKQVQINGVWQWLDCIPIETQAGKRWLPVFKAHEGE